MKTPEEAAAFVKRERKLRGWSALEFSAKIREAAALTGEDVNLTQQAISFFENGKTKSFPRWLRHANLVFMTDAIDQRAAFMIPPYDDDDEPMPSPAEIAERMGLVRVAEIDLDLGMGASFLDETQVNEVERWIPREWVSNFTSSPEAMLTFARPFGDSMYPTINDRDIVLIDRSETSITRQDAIWALVYGGLGTIKRVRVLPDGTHRLMADNQQVRDETATDGELFVIGRVAGVFRRT